jgi:two-component system response regulator YesN
MLTVLLADDEPLILRGLAKLIPWDKYGVKIIGEACSGDALLQAILERSPDIVIADISMPGMTGIDVLKKLQELGIATKMIFISAYQEFGYARDAVSYGAVDYLVKPVDRVKLEQVLKRTAALIRETSEQETNQNRLLAYEKQQKSRKMVEIFEQLIDGERIPLDKAAEIRGNDPEELFSVIVVMQDYFPNHPGSWLEGEWKLLQFAMQNVMEEVIRDTFQGWVMARREQLFVVLKHKEEFAAEGIAAKIHDSINCFLKLSVTIGVGMSGLLENTAESYRQANVAAGYKFFLGKNQAFCYRSLPVVPDQDGASVETLEKELVKAMISTVGNKLNELLDSLLQTVRCVAWGNRDYAINLCYTTLLTLFRELTQSGFPLSTSKEEQQLGHKLNSFEIFDDVSQCLKEEIGKAEALVAGQGRNKEKQQMLQVKTYIEEHYADEISLEGMAGLIYMNPYYFSSFFKKQSGQNYKQYLTEVRMRHALRLMQQTDFMVYEIAEKVGYNNARQFSEMFKKHYGKLPNEYKQN